MGLLMDDSVVISALSLCAAAIQFVDGDRDIDKYIAAGEEYALAMRLAVTEDEVENDNGE